MEANLNFVFVDNLVFYMNEPCGLVQFFLASGNDYNVVSLALFDTDSLSILKLEQDGEKTICCWVSLGVEE